MNNKKRNVLITGAAGLLGPQHAAALIEKNFSVVLIDKNLKSLKKVKKALDFCLHYPYIYIEIGDIIE